MVIPEPVPSRFGRRLFLGAALGLGTALLGGCVADPASDRTPGVPDPATSGPPPSARPLSSTPARSPGAPTREAILAKFGGKPAGAFGLEARGIQLGLPAGARGAALTFDACGGRNGEGFDTVLIAALRKHQAPATLFINRRWAKANEALVGDLAADPLFEIANHGTSHAPLASRGQSAYGIPGTASIAQAYDEVMGNQRYLAEAFGIDARFFRSGTAHMDELSARMTRELGLIPVNFTVNLDAGATFPAATVGAQALRMGRGDVGIGHFNRPVSGTGAGIAKVLPALLDSLETRNLRLMRLSEAF